MLDLDDVGDEYALDEAESRPVGCNSLRHQGSGYGYGYGSGYGLWIWGLDLATVLAMGMTNTLPCI